MVMCPRVSGLDFGSTYEAKSNPETRIRSRNNIKKLRMTLNFLNI